MRTLITGASGFVGLNIVQRLLEDGDDVIAAARDPFPERARSAFMELPGSCVERNLDVTDHTGVTALFREFRPKHLIVGAAITPGARSEAHAICPVTEVNILGALRTLEAGFDAGVERAVFLSSASVYGSAEPVDGSLEEDASIPQPTAAYGISKLAAEQLSLRMAAARGVDICAARIGTVFGPWERDTGVRDTLSPIHQVMELARTENRAEVILPREGPRDFVYAPDVARAIVALLDAPQAEGVFNIGLGREWTVADWCRALAERRSFSWRIASEGETANVDYHAATDRPPLSVRRLMEEVGAAPSFGLEEAVDHYLAWLDAEEAR